MFRTPPSSTQGIYNHRRGGRGIGEDNGRITLDACSGNGTTKAGEIQCVISHTDIPSLAEYGVDKLSKSLRGEKDYEAVLERLDRLATMKELGMTGPQTMEVSHGKSDKIKDGTPHCPSCPTCSVECLST